MIILVRHGQTVFNQSGRYQGACDSPLTGLGVQQARNVGSAVRSLVTGTASLWSSPLGRAVTTAKIVKEAVGLSCDPQVDERLREVSLGHWDGLTDEEIEQVSLGARDGSTRFDWFFRSPDGESFEQAKQRLRHWLLEVDGHGECHIAVSHGLSGRIIRGLYLGLPRDKMLRLDVPQDGVFLLADGRCRFVSAVSQTLA